MWISLKAGKAVVNRVRKIPIRTRMAMTPQVKKKALIAASLALVHFFLRIARSEPSSPQRRFFSLAALWAALMGKNPSRSTIFWPSSLISNWRNAAAAALGFPLVAW